MPAAIRLAGLFALAVSLLCCTREIEPPAPFPTDPRAPAADHDGRGDGDGRGESADAPSTAAVRSELGRGGDLAQGVDAGAAAAVDLDDVEPSAPTPPRAHP